MEPEEVNEAFNKLYTEGKVRNFGVSNHNSMQIELLNKYLNNKVTVNQLQFSIMHTGIIDSGLNVNMKNNSSILFCEIIVGRWITFYTSLNNVNSLKVLF